MEPVGIECLPIIIPRTCSDAEIHHIARIAQNMERMIIWIGHVQDVLSGEVEKTAFGWTAFRIIGDEKHLYIFNILLKGDNFNHGETGGCVGCNAHVIKQAEGSLIATQHVSTVAAIDFLVVQIVNQDIVSGAAEKLCHCPPHH